MEELTKYQIVLLTLFISFVTSLATGIVTVSLMDQSPQGFTQNINRVVERTIERVVEGPATTTTVEVPVVVSEEDLIVKVVNSARPSIAKVVRKQGDKTDSVAIAFAYAPGWAVTASLPADSTTEATYELKLESGKFLRVDRVEKNVDGSLAFLKYSGDGMKEVNNTSKESQIGQTVVALGSISEDRHGIAIGIISGITNEGSTSTPAILRTNAATADNLGAPLLNIKGETVGISYKPGQAASITYLRTLFDSIR